MRKQTNTPSPKGFQSPKFRTRTRTSEKLWVEWSFKNSFLPTFLATFLVFLPLFDFLCFFVAFLPLFGLYLGYFWGILEMFLDLLDFLLSIQLTRAAGLPFEMRFMKQTSAGGLGAATVTIEQ
jgi:hypothetical protein